MKTNFIQTAVAALVLAAAGYAQSVQPFQVNVPFDFVAGGRALPAGPYTVSQPVNTSAIAMRSAGDADVVVLTNRIAAPGRKEIGKLVFHRYGDRYFLAEVWDTDTSNGRQVPETKAERELAQGSHEVPTRIVLAAR